MDKWEYKSVKIETTGFFGGKVDTDTFDRAANELGEEGWEMISCFDTNSSEGASRYVIAVFKRMKNY